MKGFKRVITFLIVLATLASPLNRVNAAGYYSSAGGCGYHECRTAPALSPSVALAAIALAAIIAVAVQNSDNDHAHFH